MAEKYPVQYSIIKDSLINVPVHIKQSDISFIGGGNYDIYNAENVSIDAGTQVDLIDTGVLSKRARIFYVALGTTNPDARFYVWLYNSDGTINSGLTQFIYQGLTITSQTSPAMLDTMNYDTTQGLVRLVQYDTTNNWYLIVLEPAVKPICYGAVVGVYNPTGSSINVSVTLIIEYIE